jgi:hypothetical protein
VLGQLKTGLDIHLKRRKQETHTPRVFWRGSHLNGVNCGVRDEKPYLKGFTEKGCGDPEQTKLVQDMMQ